VTVTLASAVASGETVRVAYARPSANPLRGAGSSGQEVTNFTGRSVANNTPTGPSAPPPQGGRVSDGGAKVTLNFADQLDAASTPDPGDFTVTVAAASDASPAADDHYRVTAVSILGATVELTISPQIPAGREATVSYTPGTRPLRTAAGAPVPTFSVDVAVPPAPAEPTVTVEGGSAGWEIGFHRLQDRLAMVACKDFYWEKSGGKWRSRMCPLGQGMVDYPKFFKLLAASGFSGPISLHVEYKIEASTEAQRIEKEMHAIESDFAYLKSVYDSAFGSA